MKRLWKWLKRAFGLDKEFIGEMDAMVSRAEMMFLDKMAGTVINIENLKIVDMLANYSLDPEVRARARLIMRTETLDSDGMKNYQVEMFKGDAARKEKILAALKTGPCDQKLLRFRLGLGNSDEVINDHCWSLCMELESEGKVVEEDRTWRLVEQSPAQTAQ